MNNNTPVITKRRHRINAREFADKLGCHVDTVKRRVKSRQPGFPLPVLLMGKYVWWEDEADSYIEHLTATQREGA